MRYVERVIRIRYVAREYWFELLVAALAVAGMLELIILRSPGAPPWNFRCRGGNLGLEESLWIDGKGQPHGSTQLVIVGEVSALGGEIGWHFRRAS